MRKLYILPFDHRRDFLRTFGIDNRAPDTEETAMLADYKYLVYEGFLRSLELGVPKASAAVLVDEQFGARIHDNARQKGITRILTVEKSGQEEFDFEYGGAFGEHIERMQPEYVKALVRYNPANDAAMNVRQREKLAILNDFCRAQGYLFLLELLEIPTPAQLAAYGNDAAVFDARGRWELMRESIAEFQKSGVSPDIWKIEGLADEAQMKSVIGQTQEDTKHDTGVVVLGRGENEEKVHLWLSVAARIPHIVGFAVGRTIFKQPLVDFHEHRATREEAIARIAERFKAYVDLFEANAPRDN